MKQLRNSRQWQHQSCLLFFLFFLCLSFPKWNWTVKDTNYYVCCAYETQPWQSKVWIAEGNWPGQHHQSHIYAQVLWACVLVQMLQMSTVTQQLHHLCWMSCLLLLSHHPWTPAVVSLTSLGQTAAMITTSEATSIFSFLGYNLRQYEVSPFLEKLQQLLPFTLTSHYTDSGQYCGSHHWGFFHA